MNQIDELAKIRSQMEDLKKQEKKIVDFFKSQGAGAYGGNATTGFSGGGGGGSGYTSGDVEIIETNQGGNATNRAWATIALKGV